ncbi:Scr1 family TA system antitoxin-like transcriptional regulator [Streptomyces anulatus]|uniref:Scr1 family TA system antitoxin-like transcriptional regulator n=1 Tax=Streptomyces anulatus TaxID=1892 RepID=UPI0036A490D9
MTHGTDGIESITYGTFGNGGTRSAEPEPQHSLKVFGEVVKACRKRTGLTQEQFAPLVGYSVETVASIEQGRRFPPPDFVERAEAVLEAFGVIRGGAAKHLTRRKGLASWFRQWAQLELEALGLYTYECRLIPGSAGNSCGTGPDTSFSFILEEHLLLRDLDGEEVTRKLIDHILDLSELRNVDIQIMPLVRHHHAGLHGPMRLLETQEHQWFGYLEGQEHGLFVSDLKVISTLQMRCAPRPPGPPSSRTPRRADRPGTGRISPGGSVPGRAGCRG